MDSAEIRPKSCERQKKTNGSLGRESGRQKVAMRGERWRDVYNSESIREVFVCIEQVDLRYQLPSSRSVTASCKARSH